jgi:hypothetical protein
MALFVLGLGHIKSVPTCAGLAYQNESIALQRFPRAKALKEIQG